MFINCGAKKLNVDSHGMEHHAKIRMKNLQIHIIWVNLRDTMLSEARHRRMRTIGLSLVTPKTGEANL